MDKNELQKYLNDGLSTRQIAPLVGLNHSTVGYWIHKFELQDQMKYKKSTYNETFFKKIDTPEKAYILGFILGDGAISDKGIEIGIAIKDKEIVEFIHRLIGGNVITDLTLNKSKKRYPRIRLFLCSKHIINDIKTKIGGNLKVDRHIPIISKNLESYLLLGFFDAEGCISWGKRKDRDKYWQKIVFTSQFKMLIGIQKILLRYGIASSIYPKKNEHCFAMLISSRENVFKFLDIIYTDVIVLKRKYNNAMALRRELGEFGETYINKNVNMAIPSEAF